MLQLQEAQERIQELEQSVQKLSEDKEVMLIDFDKQKNQLMAQIDQLNNELAKIVSQTDQQLSLVKIENLKIKDQNKLLLQLIAEKEREIADLRLKVCTSDEELQRLRKKNLGSN